MEARMPDPFAELRPLLFSIAYRMLGSASEAEDIVQEAFLRYHRETAAGVEVDSPKSYLSAITTRLCIDHLRSARVRRESYVGTWLPEPLLTDEEADVARHAETADSLSMGFLVLLESLTPVERAVFLLREVFEYEYDEIASVVGKSEENCRQIAVRARRHVQAGRPRFEASKAQREELANRFFQAVVDGDVEELVGMLAADVVAYADGGGRATAFPRPVHGRDKVLRLMGGSLSTG
jgi:RNA polymerase sigma-70 factor (ECF subfamily)